MSPMTLTEAQAILSKQRTRLLAARNKRKERIAQAREIVAQATKPAKK